MQIAPPGEDMPSGELAGSWSVCAGCGEVSVLEADKDGNLAKRALTPEELKKAAGHEDIRWWQTSIRTGMMPSELPSSEPKSHESSPEREGPRQ